MTVAQFVVVVVVVISRCQARLSPCVDTSTSSLDQLPSSRAPGRTGHIPQLGA